MKTLSEPIVVHASTGLRMPESMARQIESAKKQYRLPGDFEYTRKSASSIPTVDAGSRSEVSAISTELKDRDGEVVLNDGIDWSTANGDVFWAHDYKELPVGKCTWRGIRKRSDGLKETLAETTYPSKPPGWSANWLPDAILHLQQQKPPLCTGKSIGFLPLEMRAATREEISRRPEWEGAPIISKAMGLEYSVAPLASNPGAEMLMVSKCASAIGYRNADLVRRTISDGVINAASIRYVKTLIAAGKVVVDIRSDARAYPDESLTFNTATRVVVDGVLATKRLKQIERQALAGGNWELATVAKTLFDLAREHGHKRLFDTPMRMVPNVSKAQIERAVVDAIGKGLEDGIVQGFLEGAEILKRKFNDR